MHWHVIQIELFQELHVSLINCTIFHVNTLRVFFDKLEKNIPSKQVIIDLLISTAQYAYK